MAEKSKMADLLRFLHLTVLILPFGPDNFKLFSVSCSDCVYILLTSYRTSSIMAARYCRVCSVLYITVD